MALSVFIEKLVSGGYGLARTDKGIVFVSGVAPHETVLAEVVGTKGGSPIARPLAIVEPSPDRRDPPCPLAGCCGGCDWLHVSYEAQVRAKRDILHDCFKRIGRLRVLPDIECHTADEFAYRHRAQIKISSDGHAGFFARGTNNVVQVECCPLLVQPLNALLDDFAALRIAAPTGPLSLMVFNGDGAAVASSPEIPGVTLPTVPLTVAGVTFIVRAQGFFQSNRPLLERFGTWPRSFVGGDFFVDLYGGSGFFSLMVARHFKQGVLVESVASQVEEAHRNFVRNGCTQVRAVATRAEGIAALVSGKHIDALIVDPPRPGLTRTVRESIARLAPHQILYVSCNPSTQARDLGFLVNHAGYRLEKVALFDLYPNTHHSESVALLRHGSEA